MSSCEDDGLGQLLARAAAMDYDDGERWEIVSGVHSRVDRPAFEAAQALAGSDSTAERILGLDILAQIGRAQGFPFAEETLPLLIAACDDDRPQVLDSAITALGHLGDTRALGTVLRHVAHLDGEVRFAVAFTLPGVAGEPPAPAAVAALIRLSGDPDPDIRDWATFGLRILTEADSAPVREALAARLYDPDGDTAAEALLGLALRHDPRALPALLPRLEGDPGELVVEAAAELGSPAALPALGRLKAEGWQQASLDPGVLDEAIRACSH